MDRVEHLGVAPWLKLARLEANRDPLTTLARLGAISTSDTTPKGSVQFVLDEAAFALPLCV